MNNEGAVTLLCNELRKPAQKLINEAKKAKIDFRLIVERDFSNSDSEKNQTKFDFVGVEKGKPVYSDEMKNFIKTALVGFNSVGIEENRISLVTNEVIVVSENKKAIVPEIEKSNEIDFNETTEPSQRKRKKSE